MAEACREARKACCALPGIGPYTAAAVGSIAFGLPLAVLDGNVMRVLARVLALREDIAWPHTRAKLQSFADAFLDRRDPSTHNQAVMELGATVCLPRKPMCLICPLAKDCRGRDQAEDFPVKSRVAQVKRQEVVAILRMGKELLLRASRRGQTVARALALSRFRSGSEWSRARRSHKSSTASPSIP